MCLAGESAVGECAVGDLQSPTTDNAHQDPEVLVAEAKRMILEMLSDGKPHPVSDLHALPLPYEPIEEALTMLISEEQVANDDGMLGLT